MKLFCYYALHSLKNQIRKLFKTWVAIFLLVCFGIGFLFGGLGTLLDEAFPEEPSEDEIYEEEIPEDVPTEEEMSEEELFAVVELVAGAVALVVLVISILGADKSGNAIFLPADVPALFASPMRPQSVLLFRLLMQSGLFLWLGFYFALQLPTLIAEGFPLLQFLGVMLAFVLLMLLSKLIQTLLYIVASTHPRVKRLLRPVTLSLLVLGALALTVAVQLSSEDPLSTALHALTAPATRFIPVWGWLKGLCMYAMEGNLIGVLLSLTALLGTGIALCVIIWRVRADFYEDAMQKSEELAAVLDAAQNSSSGITVARTNKKDRSDRLRRDGLRHGAGASVYFHKAMYNRFRFAHLRVFTKTSETYLAVAVIASLVLRFAVETTLFFPVALILSALVFFRSLGNPLSQDTQMDSFLLVPENTWKKMFFSLMGGTANCFLDLIPAFLAATLILGANPLEAFAWLLFAISVELYSTNAGVFIDLSIPVSAGKQLKAAIQVMFVYFGLLPDAVILLIGGFLGALPVAAVLASLINLALAGIFFAFSPMFLEYGRK